MTSTRLFKLISVLAFFLLSVNCFTQTNTYLIGDYDNVVDHFGGSIDNKAPFAFPYKYSCSQQIYTADELSAINGKKINKITFKARPDGNFFDNYQEETKLYLLEIEESEFIKEDGKFNWLSVSDENLVYHEEGSLDLMTISLDQDDFEVSYQLNTPYIYNGGNLLVMVVHTTTASDNDLAFFDFYCYPGNVIDKPFRTVFFSNDENDFSSEYPAVSNVALKQLAVMKIEAETLIVPNYTITASVAGGNGFISPMNAIVEANASQEFTITPASGYAVDKLILDNEIDKTSEIGENNKYLLSNINNNHSLVVNFKSATNIIEEKTLQVKTFPNPSSFVLNIEASEIISNIEIISLDGKLLDKQNVENYKCQYSTILLLEGSYFLKLFIKGETIFKQFSVVR